MSLKVKVKHLVNMGIWDSLLLRVSHTKDRRMSYFGSDKEK